MTDAYIPVSGTTDKLQTYRNTVGGSAVDSEAVTPTDSSGQPFSATNRFPVADDYFAAEILADQVGAAGVLTFTFANPMDFVWVTDVGATTSNISRVDPFGGVPSATAGIPVFNQAPSPISVTPAATVIKVYAAVGSTISMYGYRRT